MHLSRATPVSAVALRQAVILVGGRGIRLGSLTAQTPKPLLPVGGRPFLAWLVRELCRYGIEEVLLLTGHLGEQVEAILPALRAKQPRPLHLACIQEPSPAGTGGALRHAGARLDERFLLLNGDSWLDTPLARLLADAAQDSADILGRLLLHPMDDSRRFGQVTMDADQVTAFQEKTGEPGPALINAGIAVLRRDILPHLGASLELDTYPALARAGLLRGTVRQGAFIDIGIPEELARACATLPARLHRPALFLDRDGVVNQDHGYVGTTDRFDFIPGALAMIRAATEAGWHVFIVTNQSGIARGRYTEADFVRLSALLLDRALEAGGTIDDVRYCPFHPEAALSAYRQAHPWRKPAPGMVLDLIRAWKLDPARCLLIGDQPSDLAAAAAAQISGHLFPGGDLLAFATPLLRL